MKKLTKEQIILLHHELIKETGGTDEIRDEGLLDSALNAPFQSFDGIDSFPSIQQKAARLGFGLIKNHAFIDGNKRIGTHDLVRSALPSAVNRVGDGLPTPTLSPACVSTLWHR